MTCKPQKYTILYLLKALLRETALQYQTTSAVWAGALKQKAGYFQIIAICFQNKTKTWVLK